MYKVVRYIFVFLLMYLLPLDVGGVKVSYLFNFFILFFIFYKLAKISISWNLLGVILFAYSIKILFSGGLYYAPVSTIVDGFKSILLPSILIYLYNYYKPREVYSFCLEISVFFALSTLPFLLELVKPVKSGYNLASFGENDTSGFIGFFENSHTAASCLAFSALFLINHLVYFWKNLKLEKRTFLIAVVLLTLLCLYKTYVRTGYLMIIVGVISIGVANFKVRYLVPYFIGLLTSFFLGFWVYERDSTLQNRLMDNNIYAENTMGSGRLEFIDASMEIFINSNLLENIFGLGIGKYQTEMGKIVGMEIYAHNGFVTALLRDGLIGFFLFCFISVFLIKKASECQSKLYKSLSISVVMSYLAYQLVQGNVISSIMEIFLGFLFVLMFSEKKCNMNNSHI